VSSLKFSKATNYALHTMVYLAIVPSGKTIGVRPLAEVQKVSPSYLSKVLTNLVKAGFVESVTGVNGGYKLIKSADKITFLDIIQAIEGKASFFQCSLENNVHDQRNCFIESVMNEAEQKMEEHLIDHTVDSVVQKVNAQMIEQIKLLAN
jgi:Rrf2 family protein